MADDPRKGVHHGHGSRKERERKLKKQRKELILQALRLQRKRQWIASRQHLTLALKLGDGADLRRLFSVSYERVGQLWPAVHHQEKALIYSAGSATDRLLLAGLYVKVGKKVQACQLIRIVRKERPEHLRALQLATRHCGK